MVVRLKRGCLLSSCLLWTDYLFGEDVREGGRGCIIMCGEPGIGLIGDVMEDGIVCTLR